MLAKDESAAWKGLGVATVSDAMESLNFRRSVIPGMRCTVPDEVTVGTAFTIRQVIKHASSSRDEKLVRHAEVVRQLAKPGDFIVMDIGGYDDLCAWGEHHTRHCLNNGIVGALVDGCLRDATRIRRMGFPVYCRGFAPFKSLWDLETAAVGEPVMIGRVQVRPGDLIVADEDGVIVVPFADRQRILDAGQKIAAKEEEHYGPRPD